jgi:phage-related tail fiber protein
MVIMADPTQTIMGPHKVTARVVIIIGIVGRIVITAAEEVAMMVVGKSKAAAVMKPAAMEAARVHAAAVPTSATMEASAAPAEMPATTHMAAASAHMTTATTTAAAMPTANLGDEVARNGFCHGRHAPADRRHGLSALSRRGREQQHSCRGEAKAPNKAEP